MATVSIRFAKSNADYTRTYIYVMGFLVWRIVVIKCAPLSLFSLSLVHIEYKTIFKREKCSYFKHFGKDVYGPKHFGKSFLNVVRWVSLSMKHKIQILKML